MQELTRRTLLQGAGLAGIAAMGGVAAVASADEAADGFKPGVYVAERLTQAGYVTVYTQIAEDGSIADVTIANDTSYPALVMGPAAKEVAAQIVEAQSTEVDGVAGATMSSYAVKDAVRDCLAQAGITEGFDEPVEKPEIVAGEDVDVDVLVVGSGAGGCLAALDAAYRDLDGVDSGLKVMLVEKLGFLGGTSVLSGGGVFAIDPLDQEAVSDETVETVVSKLQYLNDYGEVNEPLVRNLLSASGKLILGLQRMGAPYDTASHMSSFNGEKTTATSPLSNGATGRAVFNPEGWYSPTPLCSAKGTDAFSWGYAHELFEFYNKRFEKTPQVDVRLNTAAKELIVDADGAVAGAVVEDKTTRYNVNAKKVILACGGITKNPDLIAKYAPNDVNSIAWCCGGDTGDAITMCEPLGAQVVGNHLLGYFGSNARYGAWSDYGTFMYGSGSKILVNIEGKRFHNELYSGSFSCNALYPIICEQPEGRTFGIIDSANPDMAGVQNSIITDCIWQADTLEELAELIDVPAENMVADIAAYNEAYYAGENAEFDTPIEYMVPCDQPPFYAFAMNPCGVGGLVSLKCNENCQILGADDNPIPNLYGAGEVIYGGNLVNAHMGGWGVGSSLVGGYVAVEHAKADLLGA